MRGRIPAADGGIVDAFLRLRIVGDGAAELERVQAVYIDGSVRSGLIE